MSTILWPVNCLAVLVYIYIYMCCGPMCSVAAYYLLTEYPDSLSPVNYCKYSGHSLLMSSSGLGQIDLNSVLTVLAELCRKPYCCGNNFGLSKGDHNGEVHYGGARKAKFDNTRTTVLQIAKMYFKKYCKYFAILRAEYYYEYFTHAWC